MPVRGAPPTGSGSRSPAPLSPVRGTPPGYQGGRTRKKRRGGWFSNALGVVGGDLREVGYGFADMVADYGTAQARDVVNVPVDLARGRVPYHRTAGLVKRDALGTLAFANTLAEAAGPARGLFLSPTFFLDLDVDAESGRVSARRGAPDRAEVEAARQFVKDNPLITAVGAYGLGVSPTSRLASQAALRASIRKANPELSTREVARIARKESRMPGYAAAQGIGGGIDPRILSGAAGEALGRPWSRAPLGRAGQRLYDETSATIEALHSPGAKFSTSQRAARMQERSLRKQRARSEADITRLERQIRKGVGKLQRSPAGQEALIAALEGPGNLSPRQAVEVKLADLRSTVARPRTADEARALLADVEKDLRQKLRPLVDQLYPPAARRREQALRNARPRGRRAQAGIERELDLTGIKGKHGRGSVLDDTYAEAEDRILAMAAKPDADPVIRKAADLIERRDALREAVNDLDVVFGDKPGDFGDVTASPAARRRLQRQIGDLERALSTGLVDRPAFAKALDAAESLSRQAEEAAVRVFDMSPEELAARRNLLVRRYAEKGLLPDPVDLYIERFGNVVDTDLARELIPAFGRGTRDERALLADELHETASSLSERVWNRLLEAQPVAGTVAIKAGGSGAGKTTALVDASEFDAVLDTTLSSFESATRKIDRALATGRSVEINYVHRDPAVAYTDGVLSPERLAGDGRVVPLDEHVRMHVGANETIRKLRDHYAGKPVTFRAIDNSRPGAPLTDIDALPTLKYDAIEKEVRRAYDAQAGRLTAAQREAALRSAHRETPRRPSGSGARGSRGPDGRADAARSDRGGAARGSAEDDLAFFDARGFFPHRSEYELVGGGHGAAVGRPATGAVIGKPQPGRAFERRRNELRLYSEGSVQTSPRVLSNTLRQRERFLRTEEARRWLYENGTPPGDEIPRGSMLVRNPDGPRATIPPELRAAVENPDDVARLASREGGQVEPRAFERWVDEWLWRGEGDRPEWAFDVDNVRVVPANIAETLLPDVFYATANSSVLGLLNSLARVVTIYTPYLGVRYIARNTPQNLILLALTKPKAFLRTKRLLTSLRREHPDLYAAIQAETGTVRAAAGLPELLGPARSPMRRLEGSVTTASRTVADKLGQVADEPWRGSSWLQYAREYGFSSPDELRRLLDSDDPNVRRVRDDISQRVRDDMLDFDALPPWARDHLSRRFFILPFRYAAAKWPAMFLREYPTRASIAMLAASQHEREETPGRVTSVLESGRTEIGGREVDLGWLMPQMPAAETVEDAVKAGRGLDPKDGRISLRPAFSALSPEYRSMIDALGYGGEPVDQIARAFVPGYSTYERTSRGDRTDIVEQILRMLGLEVEYVEPGG